MLLALRDSKFGQKMRQEVLVVPSGDKYPNPLDHETKAPQVALDEPRLTSSYIYKSRKDVESALPSLTAAASSEAQSEAARESITTLKRKRTQTTVATELSRVPELDDTSPLSAKRRCLDSNATDESVASKREYRGGSGFVAQAYTTESQQNIINNKSTDTSKASAPSHPTPSKTVKHNKMHSEYRHAPSPFSSNFETMPRDSFGSIPQMIEPSIISTAKRGHPLTSRFSGESRDRIRAIDNTPLSAPAKLGRTSQFKVDGGTRGEALQGLDASQQSQGTGSRIATRSGSSLPAIPRVRSQKKRAFEDGPGEEILQGSIDTPLPSSRIKAKHLRGFDLTIFEGVRPRAEASPSPAARPPVKRKRTRL